MAEYISYQTEHGQQRAVNVPLPWSTDFQGFGGQVFVLSAQGQGTIACKIVVDGNTVNDAHSTGTPDTRCVRTEAVSHEGGLTLSRSHTEAVSTEAV